MLFRNLALLFLSVCSFSATVLAQSSEPDRGLLAYYSFDSYPLKDESGNGNRPIVSGDSTLVCGVRGAALRFDGLTSSLQFIGPDIFDGLKSRDFSMSFYFKASSQAGGNAMDLFSKRKKCATSDSSFSVKYIPSSNQISIELSQLSSKKNTINYRLPLNRCWFHVGIVRATNKVTLYIDGEQVAISNETISRVDFTNDAPLAVSKSPCIGSTERRFSGTMDELRLYGRAITGDEMRRLYYKTDRINNPDTIMFLGQSVQMRITSPCGEKFRWRPSDGVSDSTAFNPIIKPTAAGEFTYQIAITDGQRCTAFDDVNIKVVDPESLNCTQLFFPTAFTPNADGLNDEFFISNAEASFELLDWGIYDAWGARMFYTTTKTERWDGTFSGREINSGVYLWKVRWKCKGVEMTDVGNVTLLK